jgi:hypothetical protein
MGLTACGGSSSKNSGSATTSTAEATTAVAAGPPLKVGTSASSIASIANEIDDVYSTHADLGAYVVQGTTYTKHSRQVVFKACTEGGTANMTENAQSERLDACAPMIFYFHSYGVARNAPDALKLADHLFTYAVDEIHGPLNSETTLTSLLRSWGIQAKLNTSAVSNKAEAKTAAILKPVTESIAAESGVRVSISGRQPGSSVPAERTIVDVGTNSSVETISEPTAHAKIVVTKTGAFLYGDKAGLTKLVGLTAQQAATAGSHWIEAVKGSKEYNDLAAENTVASLTGAILPGKPDSVTIKKTVVGGQTVKLLTWQGEVGSSSEELTEKLELSNGANPLPIQETTSASGYQQAVAFSKWGERVRAMAPAASDVVSYRSLGKK